MARTANLIHKHINNKKSIKRKQIKQFDKFVLVMSFVQPISGLPQVISIWSGNGQVSLLSWLMFAMFGLVMLCYGVAHKIKPIIITNAIWLVIDILIIVGLLKKV